MNLSPEKYVAKINSLFQQNRNVEYGRRMTAYVRNKFTFYGLKAMDRRQLQKQFIIEFGMPDVINLPTIINLLYSQANRENQYFGLEISYKLLKHTDPTFITTIEDMIVTKSWWDTVDYVAGSIAGSYFKKHTHFIPAKTNSWSESENMWLNRSALLFQLKYKKSTDTQLLARYIEEHLDSKDFFIRKAIGWALRQYSRIDKDWVRSFVSTHALSGLSYREATKYLY